MGRNDDFRQLDQDLKQLKIPWDEKRKQTGYDKLMLEVSHMHNNSKRWGRLIQFTVNAIVLAVLCVGGYYLVFQSNIYSSLSPGQPSTEINIEDNESEHMNDADETSKIEEEKEEVSFLVETFGKKLKMVSLLSPDDVLRDSINEHYGPYITSTLLEKWMDDPSTALGRWVSSPSPERIEILDIEKVADDQYEVKGKVIEGTSADSDKMNNQYPITLTIKYMDNEWLIDDVVVGDGILYENSTYGFNFMLPESWEGYHVIEDQWEGDLLSGGTETGTIILIRHPKWTDHSPRQDIPIMVMEHRQWNAVQEKELRVGSAPIPPKELGQNEQYVFALPARYNFEFLTGYEEVEEILENHPLQPINVE